MHELTRRQMLMATGAAALALAGCSSGAGSSKGTNLSANRAGAMSNFGVGTQFKATQPLTFTELYLSNPGYPIKNEWLFWSELTKRSNVTLQNVVVPLADYNNKRSLLIGAGQAPMIIPKTYPGSEVAYVAGGAILPVSDYISLMPNFQDKVAKWNLQSDINTLRQADGKYYLLPGLHQEVWQDYSLAIRTDILTKLNLKAPTTWDELHTVLQAMKTAYPNVYPMSDRWNIPTPGGNLLGILGDSYGTLGGWHMVNNGPATWDYSKKQYVFAGAMPQYRAMLQYLHTLVAEKLLDPESFTQQDTDAIAKLTSGRSFVISANAQEVVNTYRVALANVSGATISKIPLPIGPMGGVLQGSRLENGVMISKKALDSPNFVAMMQFVDWLWYSDAGQMFARWGIDGVTYTGSVDAGTFKLEPDVTWAGVNPTGTKKLNADLGFFNGMFAYGGSTKLLNTQFPAEELAFQKVMNTRKTLPVPPPYPLTADEREQATLWGTPLIDYIQQQTLKFILGSRPLSEWDQYVSELKAKNMDSFMNLVHTAYQRYQKNHG